MGCSRSGSTVLDMVLGSHPEIRSVGELSNLAKNGWLNDEYCSCGERGSACPFWAGVRSRWAAATGLEAPNEYIELQNDFERLRRVPSLLKELERPSARFTKYAAYTRALFEAVGAASGRTVIVDSSKNPVRALSLLMVPGLDVRLLHLVRDGRGVIWSLLKSYKKNSEKGLQRDFIPVPSWRTSISWAVTNYASEYVMRRAGSKGALIKYENFVEDPATTLGLIGRTVDVGFEELSDGLSKGREISSGHIIAGNRVRMNRTVRLKRDNEWEKALPERDQRIFRLIAGGMARKYGYKTR